ncbi:extracellular solute-binding protein [Erysipelothrix sp. HDW6C]|uniref:ABC transporter substrate-binding protein n=1 Tax=Erysipelothrix sp. HDW6C TaxID=2714930 RepID=UPI00140D95CC|nr:ABC transporter substrate-binding protein [Erysipelothrix sp. HDW6C]QIK70501.1 extracellular solute-binding protein [Erysipelothrix sp. HDW6C]
MKKYFKVMMIAIVALALTACSSGGNDGGEGSKTLTIYSPHPAETINSVVKEFEEKTGIKVEIVAAGTGELLKRVESEDGNAQGDVVWGGGAESLASYTEYFQPYQSKELEHVDAKYYDPEYKWIGESPLPMVMMYNTNLVSEENAPKSWKDMTDPQFKGQIAMADPAKSGSAYTIMATMVQAYGKDTGGWDFIKEFYANLDSKIVSNSSGVYKGVADGEYAVGLTLEKEAVKYVLNGAPVKLVYPDEGTSAVPDGVAIIRGAKNLDNAQTFVDFVLSKETQEFMSNKLSRRSIRDDVEAPEGLQPLADIKLLEYDFDWAAEQKDANLKAWKDIVVGQ